MVSVRSIVALAILLQCTRALVEFPYSKLYEETDFAVPELSIPIPTPESRIFVSAPDSSSEIAQKLMVHGVYQNQISLYEISKLTRNDGEKGFFVVQRDIRQISIVNMNPGNATAPIVLWIVWGWIPQTTNVGNVKVFDAANLNVESTYLGLVTVMSAEPYVFHSIATEQTQPYFANAIMAGYEQCPQPGEDDQCIWLIDQENNPVDIWEIQAQVQSPLITLFYNDEFKTSMSADVGKASSLSLSGISFATSPGYVGCNNVTNIYRSFLRDATITLNYSSEGSLYDVSIIPFLNTDSDHPVTVNDTTNDKQFTLSGMAEEADTISVQKINNLDITWTMNEDDIEQSFLLRLIPNPST